MTRHPAPKRSKSLNFFLVSVHYKRRSSHAAARLKKLVDRFCKLHPGFLGRITSVPFFSPPQEGLLVCPPGELGWGQEEIRQAFHELGQQVSVFHLSSNSEDAPVDRVEPESLRLLESGKSFCRLGLVEEARIQLQQAIQRDPGCVEAYHYLAAVLRRQGRACEALEWLKRALQTVPAEASIQFLNADVLCELGRSGEAVDHLKEAIRLKPEASSPYVKLGEVFQKLGQSDQARLAFEEGLARNPNSADAAAGLGSLFLGEGRLSQAIDYLQKALQENDQLPEARLQLGWCWFHTGRPHQAEVEFLRVLREAEAGYQLPAKFSLGRLYSHLGDHESAARLLKEVVQAQPEFAEAHHLLAQSLSQLELYEEALEHWARCIELQPQRETQLNPQLALCFSRIGEQEQAEQLALRSLKELGPRANLYELLASIYMAQDHWEKALLTLKKGEVLEPNSGLVAFQMGWCYENLQHTELAEQYYSRALRLEPSMVEAYSGLGWLYYQKNQYDVALVLFEKALELDPENPEMADHVGWVHLLMKHPGLALGYFRQALQQEPYSDFYRAHLAAAQLHLQQWEDCRLTLELLLAEPLDEFLQTFSEYLMGELKRQLGEPSKALSSKKLKLLPQEFVAMSSSGRELSRSSKWKQIRSNKRERDTRKQNLQ